MITYCVFKMLGFVFHGIFSYFKMIFEFNAFLCVAILILLGLGVVGGIIFLIL